MSELTPTNDPLKFSVHYDISFTKNLGNFQSVRINVGLTQEGIGGLAEKDKTFARVREWVENNLGTAVSEVSAELEQSN